MQNARAFFAGKKITLMGLGLLGRGLGDAKFLAETGAELIVTDLKTEAELAPSVAALANLQDAQGRPANITFHLGGHRLEDFENRDLIIKAPNTPLGSPFVARARGRGIPIEMDAALFAKLATGVTIVGITGTRGKSTTTHLIYEMARVAFAAGDAASGHKVFLGGNVKDTATLPLIDVIAGGDIIVLELDSWQLQGFEENKISPNIAVWTNFMPDHMNYYHGDVDRYFADKAAIARWQKPGDVFIAPGEIKEKIEAQFGPLTGKFIVPFTANARGTADAWEIVLPDGWEIALPGAHNRANAACAIAAARALGIPDETIKKVLKDFHALPHRLEFIGEKNGIAFYDDSNATTPEATIAALQTLAEAGRPIVLIAGGSDKELNFAPLARAIVADEKNIKKIILFEGKASEKLKALLPKDFPVPIAMASNMKDAFAAALAAAQSGDTILLSPAATSFGLFKNEYDRGEQFKNLVKSEQMG